MTLHIRLTIWKTRLKQAFLHLYGYSHSYLMTLGLGGVTCPP